MMPSQRPDAPMLSAYRGISGDTMPIPIWVTKTTANRARKVFLSMELYLRGELASYGKRSLTARFELKV